MAAISTDEGKTTAAAAVGGAECEEVSCGVEGDVWRWSG